MKGLIGKVKDKGSAIQQKLGSNRPAVLSVDSATESPEMKEATRTSVSQHVEQTHACLSTTKKCYDRYVRDFQTLNRDHQLASDSLKELSNLVKPTADFCVLGEFVAQVAEFSEQLQNISDQLRGDMNSQLLTPLDGMLEGDLAEAEFSKKRFNKVLSDYDAISKRIQQMNAKGQANPQKMQEALREQEQLQQKLDSVGQQTMQTLTDVNNRVEFALFKTLSQYVETYHLFFSRGASMMEEASHKLGKYRAYSEKKRDVIEAGGAAEQVRLEDIAANEGSTQARDALERAVMELLDKERSYVRKLDTISKSYIQNIRVDDVLASKFSEEDHRTIFNNVEELLATHKSLVAELEADMANYPNYSTGRILLAYVPRFRSYIPYVSNFSQAINALDQLEIRSRSVRDFMRTMDRKNGLRGLLGEPTGRLANYIIGLTQINNQMHPSAEERNYIADATEELGKLVDQLKDAQVVSSNIGTMLGTYNELSGFPGNLLEPTRVLRKEIMLEHHFATPEGKTKSELHKFYVCTDVIIQAKKRSVLQYSGGDNTKKMVYVNSFLLEGASVDQLPDNEEMGVMNAFELRTAGQSSNGTILCCQSAPERAELITLITQLIEGSATNPVFEVSLDVCMANQRDKALDIPEVVAVTGNYLLRHALDIEGIFRMSGAKREISAIINKFNRGDQVVLENETADEHTVAGVLKRWVRSLPEPLLSYELADSFLTAPMKADELSALVARLPPLNLRTTIRLFDLLHEVCQRSELNKMDSKNLAIVFAPGLLRRHGASDFDTSHYEAAYAVVGYMIDHFGSIFGPLSSSSISSIRGGASPPQAAGGPRPGPPRHHAPKKGVNGGGLSKSHNALNRELNAQMTSRQGRPEPPTGIAIAAAGATSSPPSSPVAPKTPPPPSALAVKKARSNSRAGAGAKSPMPPPDFQAPKMPPNSGRRGSLSKVPMQRKGSVDNRKSSLEGRSSPGLPPSPSQPRIPSPEPGGGAGQIRPPCARCNEPIRGAGLKALGVAWHKDCFVCTHCSQPFGNGGGKILQKDGKPYCEADFRKLFSVSQPKVCRACNEKISGPFMKALNGFWHASHFLCRSCGGSVAEGYYEKDDFPYCGDCFTE